MKALAYLLLGLVLALLVVGPVLALSGCTPAQSAQLDTEIALVSDAVLVADDVCATAAMSLQDAPLAEECAKDYVIAREALISAEGFSQAKDWQGAACALSESLVAVQSVVLQLTSRGVTVPELVKTALGYAPLLQRSCHG